MVNSMVFEKKNYANAVDFWNAVAMFLKLLTDNHYVATFRYEDCGNYVIDFNYDDQSMGAEYPYWLTPEEYEQIDFGKGE